MYEPYPYHIQKVRLALLLTVSAAGIIGLGIIKYANFEIAVQENLRYALAFTNYVLIPIVVGLAIRAYHIGYERDLLYVAIIPLLPALHDLIRYLANILIIDTSSYIGNFRSYYGEYLAMGLLMVLSATHAGRPFAHAEKKRYLFLIPLFVCLSSALYHYAAIYFVVPLISNFEFVNIVLNGIVPLAMIGTAFFLFYSKYEKTAYRIYFWYLSASMMLFLSILYRISNANSFQLISGGAQVWMLATTTCFIWISNEIHTRLTHGAEDVRKSLEYTLFQTEQNLSVFRSLLEQMRVGILSCDVNGDISYANQYLSNMLNISPERLKNKQLDMLFDPLNLEKLMLEQEKWNEGLSSQTEIEMSVASTKIPVLVASTPVIDRAGELRNIHHVILEFAERMQYEKKIASYSSDLKKQVDEKAQSLNEKSQELKQAKAYYETLIDGMLDILLVLNTKGNVIFANDYGKHILGENIAELNRRDLPDFLSDLNKLQSNYGESMKIELRDYETTMKSKQGATLVISWNVRFLHNDEDEKIGIMCVGRDISDYKALQEKLKEHSDNLEQLVEQRTNELDKKVDQLAQIIKIGEAILLDTELNKILTTICKTICKTGWKQTIISLKSTEPKVQIAASAGIQRTKVQQFVENNVELFRKTLRFIKDEYRIGKSYYIDPQQINFMTHGFVDDLQSGQEWNDGACLLSPIKLKNRILGFIFCFAPDDGVIPDEQKLQLIEALVQKTAVAIENKQLFEELQARAHELEFANKRQSEYFANMSHELRTPLNSVLSIASILLRDSEYQLSQEQRQHITVIQKNGERLLALINNILDLSKIDAGRMQVQHSFFALRELLDSNIDTIRPLCEQKNLKLDYSIQKQVPEYIFSDRYKIEMVFMNLLSNAVKFTQRGKITVNVKVSDRGRMLDLYIKDSGVGIHPNDIQSIFQPFRQSGNQSESQRFGSGLGLSIAKQVWHLIGGEIFVSSKQNKGTQFHLTLPIIETTSADIATPGSEMLNVFASEKMQNNANSGKRILLVDDNQDNQYALKYILEDQGFQIEFASNGKDAISLAKSLKPDIILMDMMMPGMDGYEATQRLRKQQSFQNIPIIAMTAKTKDEDKGLALEKGCNDYLTKPFTFDAVISKVDQWIGESK